MSSVLYLEQFLESLEPLPAELKKNFNDMREMDEKVELQKGLAQSMGEVSFEINCIILEFIAYLYTRFVCVFSSLSRTFWVNYTLFAIEQSAIFKSSVLKN